MKVCKYVMGFLFIGMMLLVSCASSQITPEKPLSAELGNYRNFVLSVEPMVTEDVEKELSDLRGLVLSRVMSLNVFDKVELLQDTVSEEIEHEEAEPKDTVTEDIAPEDTEPEESTLLLRILITEINKVSSASRFWLGAFAGEARMTNKLLFVDALTGEKLGEYTVTGHSGSTAYAGGTNEAIEKTVEAIVKIISNNFNM
jgi:hypothetical protein